MNVTKMGAVRAARQALRWAQLLCDAALSEGPPRRAQPGEGEPRAARWALRSVQLLFALHHLRGRRDELSHPRASSALLDALQVLPEGLIEAALSLPVELHADVTHAAVRGEVQWKGPHFAIHVDVQLQVPDPCSTILQRGESGVEGRDRRPPHPQKRVVARTLPERPGQRKDCGSDPSKRPRQRKDRYSATHVYKVGLQGNVHPGSAIEVCNGCLQSATKGLHWESAV